jgi:hypothetical protein
VRPRDRVEIATGVLSKLPADDVRSRLEACQVAFVDLDGCLFPGISYAALAAFAWVELLLGRRGRASRYRLPGLTATLPHLYLKRWLWRFDRTVSSRRLLHHFATLFRGLEMDVIERAADRLPAVPRRSVREALSRLARRMPVGILSMCLDSVGRAFQSRWTDDGPAVFSFHLTNRLRPVRRDGITVFSGRYLPPFHSTAADKAAAARQWLAAHGRTVPLVIGHDEDDVELAKLAEERGGLSIGIRPRRELRRHFRVVTDWVSLAGFLADDHARMSRWPPTLEG